ncbi:MAG: hypothetical protein HY918_00400 [Candidatus Doudnabacteria bacterium]|nr:hypothetical protein [Candidatus Doudnabacteria bacterium]
MPVLVPLVDEVIGCKVIAINGKAVSVNGEIAVEGGMVKRCWVERGHKFYKLLDPTTRSEFPSYFRASDFTTVDG